MARAEVNLRFPKEKRCRPKNEVFIRSSSRESASSEEYSRQVMQKPEYQPPYTFPYAPAYGYPYYCNPYFMYPPPDLLRPCYPRPRSCESQDSEGTRRNFDFNQNIFQIVKFKKRKTDNSKKSLEDIPHVYVYKKKKDGTDPTSDEIRKQPPTSITDEDLKLIDKFIENNARSSESSEESDECFCRVRPKPRPCTRRYPCNKPTTCRTTPRCIFKPTTKPCPTRKCPSLYTPKCTIRPTRCPNSTMIVSTTPSNHLSTETSSLQTTSNENKTTSSDCTTDQSVSTNTFKSTTSDSNDPEKSTVSGNITTCSQYLNTTHQYCTTERPQCKYDKNVILNKVIHSCVPCTDRPKNSSSCDVSDMIKFIKINLCDLANSYCNCSSCDCSSEEGCKKCNKKCKKCGRCPPKDIDHLYYNGNCPNAVANYPYYNPYVNNVCPWGYPRYGSYAPFGNPCQCDECYNRKARAISPGYFEPLQWFPPWFNSGLYRGNQSSCKRIRRCSRH